MTAQPDDKREKDKDQPKKKPLYLNWQLWIVSAISLLAVTVGLVIAFGPVAIIAPIGVISIIVSSTAGPVIEAWSKIDEKLKEVREKAEQAEEKALIQGRLNSEIEKKADRAESTAVVLSDKVDTNAEGLSLLERSYEAISRRYETLSQMAERLTNDLQEERAESKLVTAQLKAQNHEQQNEINWLKENHKREIAELKEQIRLMGVEKSSDKEKIVRLESQVKQLQDRVKELEDQAGKLTAENEQLIQANYELKNGLRRRATDNLNPNSVPNTD